MSADSALASVGVRESSVVEAQSGLSGTREAPLSTRGRPLGDSATVISWPRTVRRHSAWRRAAPRSLVRSSSLSRNGPTARGSIRSEAESGSRSGLTASGSMTAVALSGGR
ncbi:hypothetical protein TPA0910_42600 [Streptomyces hygroscopicus subsp. sporocinereus]|uniref:Uncharacterized protein n=1 Tax=Streptomyces hygroscopicus TaxID=1912 RepID=A0ABQ3U2L6_STRHY|nr:hypothetical protein [Streptomyces hygroscopicus]GHJ29827.1 hypothetical protein TPA0910_42600 [Streptomyces hygroscopicus]